MTFECENGDVAASLIHVNILLSRQNVSIEYHRFSHTNTLIIM